MNTLRKKASVAWLVAVLILAGCGGGQEGAGDADTTDTTMLEQPMETAASAQLVDSTGANAGTLTFTQANGGVRVEGQVQGLSAGDHGMHIHEGGVCETGMGAAFTSAGAHYDPMATASHGGPDTPVEQRHYGDLGNIQAGADGIANVGETFDFLSLSGPQSIIGHTIMIHASADDLQSQPAGNSGAKVVCGVIETGAAAPVGPDTTGMGTGVDTTATDTSAAM
jgi:Cu-Zn family superoxide dismutase